MAHLPPYPHTRTGGCPSCGLSDFACTCIPATSAPTHDYPNVKVWDKLKNPTGEGALPGPGAIITMPPPEPPTTALAFIFWLRGYFAAGGAHTFTQGDWKRIAEELAKVRP